MRGFRCKVFSLCFIVYISLFWPRFLSCSLYIRLSFHTYCWMFCEFQSPINAVSQKLHFPYTVAWRGKYYYQYQFWSKKYYPKKFFIRRNNNKVDSIETGRIVIADFRRWSDLEKCMYTTFLQLMIIKFYQQYLMYKYSFICLLFWTTRKLTSDIKII